MIGTCPPLQAAAASSAPSTSVGAFARAWFQVSCEHDEFINVVSAQHYQ
jgi:hypothetical protein